MVIAGRRRDAGERLARTLGDGALFMRTDVTVEADVEATVNRAVEEFGRLDCLVSNAGTGSQAATIDQIDLADFHAAMAVHVHGVLSGLKYAARVMIPQKSDSIINMASVMGTFGRPGNVPYSTAKAAILGFTRALAHEVAVRNIRVNSIAPGWIHTDMTAPLGPLRDRIAAQTPLRRLGEPDDIAWAAVYLASDEARYMTGQVISPNGGWYMSQ